MTFEVMVVTKRLSGNVCHEVKWIF